MTVDERAQDLRPLAASVYAVAATGSVALIVGLAAVVLARPADALPSYAQQTGLACGRCHVSPAGGGTRTAFGNAFAANGHKVPTAAKPAKSGAAGTAPSGATGAPAPSAPVVTGGGGYYSSVVNPRFGYGPELGYSNGVFFRIYPHSD